MSRKITKTAAQAELSNNINHAVPEKTMNAPLDNHPVTDAAEQVVENPAVPHPPAEPEQEAVATVAADAVQPPAVAEEEKATPEQFAAWLKAAEFGNSEGQFQCGCCYEEGIGVDLDLERAAYWYGRAVAQGHVEASGHLAYCYEYGLGVPKDRAKAAELLEVVADAGNAKAQSILAGRYAAGDGVEQDPKAAFEWAKRAANQGDVEAMELLSEFLRDGTGAENDIVASVLWHERAERQRQRQRKKKDAPPAEGLAAVAEAIADKVELAMPDDGDDLFVPKPEIERVNHSAVYKVSAEEAQRIFKDPPSELRDALASGLTDLVFESKLGLPSSKGSVLSILHTASRQLRAKLLRNDASERAEAITNILGSMVASGCLYSQYSDFLIGRIEDKHLNPAALREHLRGKIEVEDHLLRVIEVLQAVHNLPGFQSGVKVTATGDNSTVHVQQLNLNGTAKADPE